MKLRNYIKSLQNAIRDDPTLADLNMEMIDFLEENKPIILI